MLRSCGRGQRSGTVEVLPRPSGLTFRRQGTLKKLNLLGSNVLCSFAAEGRRGAHLAALPVRHGPPGSVGCTQSGSGRRA